MSTTVLQQDLHLLFVQKKNIFQSSCSQSQGDERNMWEEYLVLNTTCSQKSTVLTWVSLCFISPPLIFGIIQYLMPGTLVHVLWPEMSFFSPGIWRSSGIKESTSVFQHLLGITEYVWWILSCWIECWIFVSICIPDRLFICAGSYTEL